MGTQGANVLKTVCPNPGRGGVGFVRGFPGCSYSKESACNARDPGSIPGSGRCSEKEMAAYSSILPGKSHGRGSLVDYSPWGHKESDMTE